MKVEYDPLAWLAGALGTIGLSWVALTSKTQNTHGLKIATLEAKFDGIKDSLERLEDHFGTKP